MNRRNGLQTLFLSLCFCFSLKHSAQNYFQQEVNYEIKVTLNDVSHELHAFEKITYINNSFDSLDRIYIHLWPNAYKNNKTALAKQLLQNRSTDMYFAEEADLGYIDSLDFKTENGKPITLKAHPTHIDIAILLPDQPIAPGDTYVFTTPFHVKIPNAEISRLGHIEQAYMITQWYPKPAVYDEAGWHEMPYLDQGEFFSEYGTFDVQISVPANYVLAATGEMIDDGKELTWLNSKIQETEKRIAEFEKGNKQILSNDSFPPSDRIYKTLRFKQSDVHDFAWFCDKRFNVLRSEVVLPNSQRTVNTWSYFTNPNLPYWRFSSAYLNDAIFFYSLWNGDYLYNNVSAIDGTISAGGGMEYPTITVIGNTGSEIGLETVIMHEVGHNWFYGMLGSNERENGWMDEGINSFNEMRYIFTKYPRLTLAQMIGRDSTFALLGLNKFKQKSQYELFYQYIALQKKDQACQTHSAAFTETNYGAIMYSKTALLFNYLMNYMGEEDFDKAMQFYFDKWKLHHPTQKDLRNTLEYFSNKNLSWFFEDLIGSTKPLDYKITHIKKLKGDSIRLTVKNNGEIAGPVAICALLKGEIKAMVWYDGFFGKKELTVPPLEADEIRIDYFEFMPDLRRKNNSIRKKGMLKKVEPLKVHFIAALDQPYNTQLFVTPVAGYNFYNGFMAGAALYNHVLFPKKLEWEIMPLYAFKNKNLAGSAQFRYNYFGNKLLNRVSVGIKAKRYSFEDFPFSRNYNKLSPYLELEPVNKNPRSSVNHLISYRFVSNFIENYKYEVYPSGPWTPENTFTKQMDSVYIHQLKYRITNKRIINPFNMVLDLQFGKDMTKATATVNYDITLKKGKAFKFRLFAGQVFSNANNADIRLRMSGYSGTHDYLFDGIYFARNEGLPNIGYQQFTENDGAFKVWTPVYSDNYMFSLNLKSPTLLKLPLYLYADFGFYDLDLIKPKKEDRFLYSFGLGLPIIKGFCEIYFPLLNSKKISDYQKLNLDWKNGGFVRYFDTVRFTFNLSDTNPFELIKNNLPF